MPKASFKRLIASSVLPRRKLRPPRLFVSWPTWTLSASSSYAAGADEGANRELRHAGGAGGREERAVLARRIVVLARLDERLGARERAFEPAALVGGDAVRKEAWVDAEPRREPFDRLAGRLRLAALDLGDVLLREALACEVALGEAAGHAKLAEALAEPKPAGGSG